MTTQIVALGQFEHLAILLTLVAVLWLLARDLGYKNIKLEKEGMNNFGDAHGVRFLSAITGANNGGPGSEGFSSSAYEAPSFHANATAMDQVGTVGSPLVNGAYYGDEVYDRSNYSVMAVQSQKKFLESKGLESMKGTRASPYDRAVGGLESQLNKSLNGL